MRKTDKICRLAGKGKRLLLGELRGVAPVPRHAAAVACACLLAWLPLHMGISSPSYCAYAATWPAASSQEDTLTGFHESYRSMGASYVHSGVDIRATAGCDVLCPVGGRVTFVGRVPAQDGMQSSGAGQTMTAVSIGLDNGKTVTLMPVKDVRVAKGDTVSEGETLAVLASGGDRSSNQPHLHMGLKKDGVYYDPLSLFGTSKTTAATDAVAAAGAVAKEKRRPLNAKVQQEQESASSAGEASSAAEEAVKAKQQVKDQESFGNVSSAAGNAVSVPAAALKEDAGLGFAADALKACGMQASSFAEGFMQLCDRAGVVLIAATSAGMASLLVVVSVLGRKAYLSIRRSSACSKNKKFAPLFDKRGGANIPKLFPAPGTSFITRGRLAQRR